MTAASIVLCCGNAIAEEPAGDDTPANAAAKSVHDEAVRILESIQTTKYQHRTKIDEEKGIYLCDCSGLVGYVLNRTVGKEQGEGPFGDGRKRPLAMHYQEFFAAAPTNAPSPRPSPKGRGTTAALPKEEGSDVRWQRVVRLVDARPGDVIAWRKEKPRPGNTGHVVIVDERPVLEANGLVRVVVIDSTTKPLVDDTRAAGTSGIGRGSMWFKIDDEGRPVAHLRRSPTAEPVVESISIGRALAPVKKSARRAA
jgi:hypothetical protein